MYAVKSRGGGGVCSTLCVEVTGGSEGEECSEVTGGKEKINISCEVKGGRVKNEYMF